MKSPSKDLLSFFMIAIGWMWLLNLPRVMASQGIITFLSSPYLKIIGNTHLNFQKDG